MSMSMLLLVGALVAATALSSYNRILGGAAGVLITVGVAVWGWTVFDKGGGIAFFGVPMGRSLFLSLMGVLTLINVVQMVRGIRSRNR
ncbi:MAG: hypothetical protein ABIJ09_01430 [Pseudomonadota bacterium]